MAELDLQDMLIQLFSPKDNRSTWRVRTRLMKHIVDYSIREHRSGLLGNVIEKKKSSQTIQYLYTILKYNLGKLYQTLLTSSQSYIVSVILLQTSTGEVICFSLVLF